MREFAADTGVNPNTVQWVLGALDGEGLTATERTAGRFVTTSASAIDAVRRSLASGATDVYIDPSPPSAWTWTRPRRSSPSAGGPLTASAARPQEMCHEHTPSTDPRPFPPSTVPTR